MNKLNIYRFVDENQGKYALNFTIREHYIFSICWGNIYPSCRALLADKNIARLT